MGILDTLTQIGGAISPIIPAISGIMGGQSVRDNTAATNAANAAQAKQQMDFQERMSSTAVQRQVKDYQAAGLNPALAYNAGGSSTPGGAAATMQSGEANAQQVKSRGMEDTLSALSSKAQIENTNAQTHQLNIESLARLKQIQTDTEARSKTAQAQSDKDAASNREITQRTNQDSQKFQATFPFITKEIEARIEDTYASARDKRAGANLKEIESDSPTHSLDKAIGYLFSPQSAQAAKHLYDKIPSWGFGKDAINAALNKLR
ncbi:DNA pilot protein [Blackfly microvirus SF02]|uniref:DNA pilot protein n=1 Tax=Blackfly microvirus SF02 TaxID=2576452 RepID=A0A4V1F5G9_9VIRU|nr:DNA pilot protein [Blackfly microvirus SF02]QCQ85023.1 DNA pilot protein [Blackfly microvirus SF02]